MRATCIINPRAGHKPQPARIADAIFAFAREHSWDVETRFTAAPGEATALARNALPASDVVVAVGGDGTLHEVASALVGSKVALGIVPCGSGNGFARSLGIPMAFARAIPALDASRAVAVDVGTVNGEPFFATAGIGLDAEISLRFAQGRHGRGILPYFWYGLVAWMAHQPQQLTIRIGDSVHRDAPLALVVANTEQYGGGAVIAPGASPFDGLLNVCSVRPASVFRIAYDLPRLFNGSIHHSSLFSMKTTAETIIEREKPGPYHVDGEPRIGSATLRFAVLPASLNVLVPIQ
jgi:YegS/Rv2252/BmrU family lipid kinase